jgi:hypothetical protein
MEALEYHEALILNLVALAIKGRVIIALLT